MTTPGLLQHLAFGGLAQGFAELNTPAGNGPCAGARRLSTFDQKHPIVFEHYGAYRHARAFRVSSILNRIHSSSLAGPFPIDSPL